jgi:hypothetical protein
MSFNNQSILVLLSQGSVPMNALIGAQGGLLQALSNGTVLHSAPLPAVTGTLG